MKPKFLLILSLTLMMTPTLLYWLGPLRRPALADGDALKLLACPACQGSGQTEAKTCSRCRGKKEVLHVLPGPHRPIYLVGQVYGPDGTTPAVGAELTFTSSAGSWKRQTDAQGLFGADLGPGSYPLQISSPQGQLTTSVEVGPQASPSPVDLNPRFPTRVECFVLKAP